MKKITLNTALKIAGGAAVLIAVYFAVWWNHAIIVRNNLASSQAASVITGLPCEHPDRRPVAVMLANDPVARPLSGISQADLIVEMPVTPSGITRLMAVYQCRTPDAIGSVRSARDDFIPLVAGFKAIYAHWGGEAGALEKLNAGIVDNVDALKYEGTAFYRKPGVSAPHNGFTTIERIATVAQQLRYSSVNTFAGYPHTQTTRPVNIATIAGTITAPYPAPYDVRWEYDRNRKTYRRLRNGTPETDALGDHALVTAGVVIVMETTSKPVGDQYLQVSVQGSGRATVYQGGSSVPATWKKDPIDRTSKLMFVDDSGKEIPFLAGNMWIEIVTHSP